MLWSKEMRTAVSRQNPDLSRLNCTLTQMNNNSYPHLCVTEFDQVSKRLGELWSTVSQAERMVFCSFPLNYKK